MNLADKGIVFEMKRCIMTHLDTDFTSEPIEKLVCIILFTKVIYQVSSRRQTALKKFVLF